MSRRAHGRPAAPLVLVLAVAAAVALSAAGCTKSSKSKVGTANPTTSTSSPTTSSVRTGVGTLSPVSATEDVYAHTRTADMSAAVAGVPARVYVPNSDEGTVDVIDPATFKIIDHFKVGRNPQHIAPSWDLKTLYVDNDLGNSLTPIDPRTGKRGANIPVTDPYNLYFTPDGTKAIVVAERLRRLDIRDAHTWKLLTTVPIAHSGPDHLDFAADGSYLLISCEFSGYVVKVDTATWKVTGEINVGGSPIDVRISPSGELFYVANQQRDGVSLIDPNALTEVSFIKTGKGTHGIYPSRDGKLLYASNRGEGTVSVIDMAAGKVVATWRSGGSPDMGGVTPDGSQLWLSGRYNQEIYVLDTTTGAVIKTIKVGRGPHGLCVFPQPGRFSLGHTGNYR